MVSFLRQSAVVSCFLTLMFCGAAPAFAQDRLALLLEGLSTPGTPAVKAALVKAGYSVIDPGVVNRDGIEWAVDIFRRKVGKISAPGSVIIVYVQTFATSDDGETYLLANPGRADDTYRLNDLFVALSDRNSGDIAVVLDICHAGNKDIPGAFAGPFPSPEGILIAGCRPDKSGAGERGAMSGVFADALLTPELTLRDIVTRTDRGAASAVATVPVPGKSAAKPSPGGPPADRAPDTGTGEDNSLEGVVWNAIKGTADNKVLTEYLERFPDSKYVPDARSRLAELAAERQAEADRLAAEQAAAKLGNQVASVEVKREAPKTLPALSLPNVQAPADATRFTGAMSGTDATGWGNLYRLECGAQVGYRITLNKQDKFWKAEMVRQTDGFTINFEQRDRPNKDGIVLLYAASEGAKVTLKVRPGRSERATYSIPTAGIGACAVGYLN